MARTLEQIISELNPTFQAQTQSLEQRAQLIPGQIQAEESALGAKKDEAYGDIINGARRRGLGFSGVPLGEQARYAATEYAPALARLRQSGQERAMSLQDAILGINERRDTLGQQIYQTEQDRDAQERAAAAARAAAARPSLGNIFGNGGGGGAGASTLPKITQSDSGYAFTDPYGKPISAADYVRLYNSQGGQLTYRQLLQQMANTGDANAKVALNYVGDDAQFGNAPAQYRAALEALGATGSYQQPSTRTTSGTSAPTTFANGKSLLGNVFPSYGR